MMPIRQKMNINVPKDIEDIHNSISSMGHHLYIVGGAVRDSLLGKIPKDYDLVTDASPDSVISMLQGKVESFDTIGKHFGIVMVRTFEGNDYEIATFRKDANVAKDSDEEKVDIDNVSIADDVLRRDLTINSLFYDINNGEIVDYVGGIDDTLNGVIRAVGIPSDRFNEDKTRILRAVRFASRFGSEIDRETADAIISDPGLRIGDIGGIKAEERITEEFKRGIATSQNPSLYVGMLGRLGLLEEIFPGMNTVNSSSTSRDVMLHLALILQNNNIEDVKKILTYIRHSNEDINGAIFLLKLLKHG